MNNLIYIFSIIMVAVLFAGCDSDEERRSLIYDPPRGPNAPEDAYFHGNEFAYYGTDSPWNQRFFYGYFDDWYKRIGQRMMLDLMDNKIDETATYARHILENRYPNDLEALFNLAVSLAHQDRMDEAMERVKQSVEHGLPFGRYLAGPRDILRPLTESPLFKEYASNFNIPVLHGPMVGRVTDRSASFWVRTPHEDIVQVRLSRSRSMNDFILSSAVIARAADDYTAIVTVNNLDADTRYYYELIVNSVPVKDLGELSFRTYPLQGTQSEFSVVFGGGGGFVPPNERIWTLIKDKQPHAFLALGDNVYVSAHAHPFHPLALHQYTYYQRQSREEFRNFVSSASVYSIWDDHEFTDDVWLGPFKHKPLWKVMLYEQYRENWINPSYGTDEWPGCWHTFSIGDVDFFMLDGRYYRTNPYATKPEKSNNYAAYPTMLGPVQKEWLFETLKKSKATFKVIASPVPWSFEAKPGSKDTWNGFQEERKELFDLLADHDIDGVILLAADRHRSDAWKIERPNGYPLYEFMSSRLTNEHTHPVKPESLFGFNEKPSFGLLRFNTTSPDPMVTYEIYSIDDEKVYSLTLTGSMLTDKVE
jgi:alkaline phosphatase D